MHAPAGGSAQEPSRHLPLPRWPGQQVPAELPATGPGDRMIILLSFQTAMNDALSHQWHAGYEAGRASARYAGR